MLYLVTTYLPVIQRLPMIERARTLLTILPSYSPLALSGVVILALTGPLSATFRFTSWDQLFSTAYGRTLIVKILLVGGLIITSAYHVVLLRPRLRKEVKKYTLAAERLQNTRATAGAGESSRTEKLISRQVEVRQGRLASKTQHLVKILHWEPVLGVGVLICVGLMNVFGGTLVPAGAAQQPPPPVGTNAGQSLHQIVATSDKKFSVTLDINPNRFGSNLFTVTVVDTRTGKVTTNVGVALYTTMLDMDMGTDSVNLLPDGKGHFSGNADLSMGGHWQVRIQIRTPDETLHEANVTFFTPY
jgi:hypothetical protein